MIVHFFREPIAQLLTAHNIFETKVFVTLQAQVFLKQIFKNYVFFCKRAFCPQHIFVCKYFAEH